MPFLPSVVCRRWWRYALPAFFVALDAAVTLAGQPDAYWTGGYEQVNEISPHFAFLLRVHPLALVAGNVLWIGAFSLAIALLPRVPSLAVSLGFAVAHAANAFNWLLYHFEVMGYWLNALYFGVLGVLLASAVEFEIHARSD